MDSSIMTHTSDRDLTEKDVRICFAPMEGLTTAGFRRAFAKDHTGMDRYFTPFLAANQTLHFQKKEIRDILPENNRGLPVVPQILSNKADEFVWAVGEIASYGYEEIDLNLGCSMPQVARRGKGAGFLKDPEKLDRFFEESFHLLEAEGSRVRLSVKTRMGFRSPEEAEGLMRIFNRYPLAELIIHPRTAADLYGNSPDLDTFGRMLEESRCPVCYNGDIECAEQFAYLRGRFPSVDTYMIGRGFLRNPLLLQELQQEAADAGAEAGRRAISTGAGADDSAVSILRGGAPLKAPAAAVIRHEDLAPGEPPLDHYLELGMERWKAEREAGPARMEDIRSFHDSTLEAYRSELADPRQALPRMKEVWWYLQRQFPGQERAIRKIRKAKNLQEYEAAAGEIFHG